MSIEKGKVVLDVDNLAGVRIKMGDDGLLVSSPDHVCDVFGGK